MVITKEGACGPLFLTGIDYYFPKASFFRVAARSVFSHGRSTSSRPKWPYAAVLV